MAARDELVERGAAGLTMEGVARRAGASKETLYAWFGTRDDLIGAVIEATADDSAQRVEQLSRPTPQPWTTRATLLPPTPSRFCGC